MSRIGPCLCGDTECPSCGPLLGNPAAGYRYGGPEAPPSHCEVCGRLRAELDQEDGGDWSTCGPCLQRIAAAIRQE